MEMDWRVCTKKADFYGIAEEFGISPVVARVITNRGVAREDIGGYLGKTHFEPHNPHDIPGIEKGCQIIRDSIRQKAPIRVVGDYDVDGVTSAYILYDGLKKAGADVSVDIPDRVKDGYGMSPRIIRDAREEGVKTVITCDNGIAAFEAVSLAKEYGMKVVVTDHHELKYECGADGEKHYIIPDADAVIDIKSPDCNYPFTDICGAAVAYKFLLCLYEYMGLEWGSHDRYMEFVGLATECDVMPLVDENRFFVKKGLRAAEDSENIGFRALLDATGLTGKRLSSYHFGFVIGPCINAAGRLDSALDALALFLAEDNKEAEECAEKLVSLNESRKSMTNEGVVRAVEQIEKCDTVPDVLVVYLPDVHESVAGIIAGRIRDRYYRPAYVLTQTKGRMLKGSGRAIKGYNMFEELTKCSELFAVYGGHELAAGFTLKENNPDEMRRRLNACHTMTADVLVPKLMIDVPMPMSYPTVELVRQLELLEPFGKDNEKPLFAEAGLRVAYARLMGKEGQFVRLTFADKNGNRINAVDFDANKFISCIKMWFGEQECDKMFRGKGSDALIDVAYTAEINEYNGEISVQIRPVHYRKTE